MTATDELRKLLDERGVEHYDGTETTLWLKDGTGYRASADLGLNGFIHLHLWCITPAQAIAVTLGNEDVYTREDVESAFVRGYSLGTMPVGSDPQWDENRQTVDEHMEELGWVRAATGGILSAEQVREAIERHFDKVAVLDDGKPVEWRDDWVCRVGIDYKSITDELNATLGSGECEDRGGKNYFVCSQCNARTYKGDGDFNFCPNCGKVVKQ